MMLWALTLPLYAANWRRCCNLYCCSRGTRPFILLFVGTQIFLLLIVGAPQQCFCLHSSLTRRPPSRPRHRSSPPAALSQVVSSGDETGYSGRLRSSARPRQDDQDTERARSRSRTSVLGELQGRRLQVEGLRKGRHTTPRNEGRPGRRSRGFGRRRRRSNLPRLGGPSVPALARIGGAPATGLVPRPGNPRRLPDRGGRTRAYAEGSTACEGHDAPEEAMSSS